MGVRRHNNSGYEESPSIESAIEKANRVEQVLRENSRRNVESIIFKSNNHSENIKERKKIREITGLSQSHLTQILNGRKHFTLTHLYLISQNYNCSIESLLS